MRGTWRGGPTTLGHRSIRTNAYLYLPTTTTLSTYLPTHYSHQSTRIHSHCDDCIAFNRRYESRAIDLATYRMFSAQALREPDHGGGISRFVFL